MEVPLKIISCFHPKGRIVNEYSNNTALGRHFIADTPICIHTSCEVHLSTFSDFSLRRLVPKPTDAHKNILLVARLQAGLIRASS